MGKYHKYNFKCTDYSMRTGCKLFCCQQKNGLIKDNTGVVKYVQDPETCGYYHYRSQCLKMVKLGCAWQKRGDTAMCLRKTISHPVQHPVLYKGTGIQPRTMDAKPT